MKGSLIHIKVSPPIRRGCLPSTNPIMRINLLLLFWLLFFMQNNLSSAALPCQVFRG